MAKRPRPRSRFRSPRPHQLRGGPAVQVPPLDVPAPGTTGGTLLDTSVVRVAIPALPLDGALGVQTGSLRAAPVGATNDGTESALLAGASASSTSDPTLALSTSPSDVLASGL